MRIAQINVVASLSTGRIAVSLCRTAMQAGHRALICHSRDHAPADVPSYVVGSKAETLLDLALTRLTDRAGFFSRYATRRLIRQLGCVQAPTSCTCTTCTGITSISPCSLPGSGSTTCPWCGPCMTAGPTPATAPTTPWRAAPRRWTAAAAGPGRKDRLGCDRWLGGCGRCVRRHAYPSSWFLDQSARNWRDKRELFCGLRHMVLTTPSEWLREEVKRSFLSGYPVYALPNGVDLTVFQPCSDEQFMRDVARFYGLDGSGAAALVISAAAVWDERKGLDDLIDLSEALGPEYCVVAVGLDEYQIASLPKNTVLGVKRTGNTADLCALYTAADVYLSASHEESMGMTLVEALACGTQVVCYDATAMPEIVTDEVGEVVPLGDIAALADAVRRLCAAPRSADACRAAPPILRRASAFPPISGSMKTWYRHSPAWEAALAKAAGKAPAGGE